MGRKALLISLAIACFLLLPRSASQAVSIDQKRGTLPYIQVSPPRPIQVRFEGIISEITTLDPNSIWRIAGVNILVTANTEVLPVGYPPSVGDRARVEALHQNGQLVGQRITIDIGPIEARIVEFQGAITSIQAGEPGPELVIAGTRVLTTKDTLVMGDLALGFLARVRGELLPDDSVLASEINTESPSVADRNVEFEDEIVQIQPSYWYFGDRNRSEEEWIKVWVTNAEIPNQGRVGLTAEVRGVKQQDGSVEAAFILVEEINPVDEVRFRGVVTQLGIDQWAIDKEAGGEEIVYLDNSSFIDESRAPAVAGNLAQVLAITRADGSLLALRISMGRP